MAGTTFGRAYATRDRAIFEQAMTACLAELATVLRDSPLDREHALAAFDRAAWESWSDGAEPAEASAPAPSPVAKRAARPERPIPPAGEGGEASHRSTLVALVLLILLVGLGLWATGILHHSDRIQDCVMQGRTNC